MSQIIGSCLGAFSASCLGGLLSPSAGDFRSSHRMLAPSLDLVLMLSPFLVSWWIPSNPSLSHFLVGYVVSLIGIQSLLIFFPNDMDKRYYGIRAVVPIMFGILYLGTLWYYPTDPGPALVWYSSLAGSMGIAFVTAVCVSDLGFRANRSVRDKLNGLGDELWIKPTVRIMLGAVCLLPLFFAIKSEFEFGYMHEIFLVGILVLSITASGAQRGSILSAALTSYSIVAIHKGIAPVESAVIFATVYNTFLLNKSRKDTEMLPDLPLLDDAAIASPMSSEEASNVRFKYLCNNLIMASFFTDLSVHAETFFLVTTMTALWILAAPLILAHRYFPA